MNRRLLPARLAVADLNGPPAGYRIAGTCAHNQYSLPNTAGCPVPTPRTIRSIGLVRSAGAPARSLPSLMAVQRPPRTQVNARTKTQPGVNDWRTGIERLLRSPPPPPPGMGDMGETLRRPGETLRRPRDV